MTARAFRHLETTAPAVITCRRCRQPLIHGIAEGVIASTDPSPLDPAAEAVAVAAGRVTFTLTRTGLVQRDETRRNDPALTGPVLAEHDCSRRIA